MLDKLTVGRRGEEEAFTFLKKNNFRVVEQNFRCRLGEVDIIAWDQEQLVFVEVRARTSYSFASAEETVNARKQQKLRKLAMYYLSIIIRKEISCRFDVVTVLFDNKGNVMKINHYQGAF